MPELPDVEGFKRYFNRYAAGQEIEGVEVIDRSLLRNASPQGVGRGLRGRRFEGAARHGKWLIADAGGPAVLMHFGMTGLLHYAGDAGERHPHDRIAFGLAGGELRYRNMRKFGGVWLARDERERERITGPLGPDAMALSKEAFGELLERRRGTVKAALMDQRLIAGLGNLLSDEIVWRARVHPSTPVGSLTDAKRAALFDAMVEVLRASNPRGRVPPEPSWLTGARDDRTGRCPRCDTRLRRATIAGRTACWCPRCQRERR